MAQHELGRAARRTSCGCSRPSGTGTPPSWTGTARRPCESSSCTLPTCAPHLVVSHVPEPCSNARRRRARFLARLGPFCSQPGPLRTRRGGRCTDGGSLGEHGRSLRHRVGDARDQGRRGAHEARGCARRGDRSARCGAGPRQARGPAQGAGGCCERSFAHADDPAGASERRVRRQPEHARSAHQAPLGAPAAAALRCGSHVVRVRQRSQVRRQPPHAHAQVGRGRQLGPCYLLDEPG